MNEKIIKTNNKGNIAIVKFFGRYGVATADNKLRLSNGHVCGINSKHVFYSSLAEATSEFNKIA